MEDLIKYIVEKITGTKDFSVEKQTDDERETYEISIAPDLIGMVIGKRGKTIRAIRKIVKIKAVLEDKSVNVNVKET
ncbi:MAG: KH domain-containing protein [Candidatus Woesebacteria bacterium]|jgi:predicted RNA-binding protein YlqC (UPF0109 family)